MFATAQAAREFMLAGNAVVTLRSRVTSAHYTFRVQLADSGRVWFVSVLRSGDDWQYVGLIGDNEPWSLRLTRKSTFTADATCVRAFRWALAAIVRNDRIPPELDIMHEGRCGKCGRPLTRPDSIERGLGPVCEQIIDKAKAAC